MVPIGRNALPHVLLLWQMLDFLNMYVDGLMDRCMDI